MNQLSAPDVAEVEVGCNRGIVVGREVCLTAQRHKGTTRVVLDTVESIRHLEGREPGYVWTEVEGNYEDPIEFELLSRGRVIARHRRGRSEYVLVAISPQFAPFADDEGEDG